MRVLRSILISGIALLSVERMTASAKSIQEYEKDFSHWMKQHHVTFSDALEFVHRLQNYIQNDRFIKAHNDKKDTSFTLGHNEFSHLTFDEFRQRLKGFQMPEGYLASRNTTTSIKNTLLRTNVQDAPESIDWVEKGGVTAVKNQGMCGSCWAFSTTGAVEGATFVASGKLPNLSEQELVDCDHDGDMGCNGGLMDHAFSWIENHGGICAETDYTYQGKEGVCRTCNEVVKVTGYQDVPQNDEVALKKAVAQQPVSVAIEADQPEFQFYKSGVFDKTCGTKLDHGVLIVGYGVEDDKKFWKIKNSWGETWGEGGYIRISRELGPAAGQCGVAMAASYPFAHLISDDKPYDSKMNEKIVVEVKDEDRPVASPIKSSAKISQCGDKAKEIVQFDKLDITPKNPKRAEPISFFGNGHTTKAFNSSAFKLTVKLAGDQVFAHKGAMCGETHIPLPLGLGHIDVHGFSCPIKQGNFDKVEVDVNLPSIAPSGNYEIELVAKDGNQDADLFCVHVDLSLEDEEKYRDSHVYEYLSEM